MLNDILFVGCLKVKSSLFFKFILCFLFVVFSFLCFATDTDSKTKNTSLSFANREDCVKKDGEIWCGGVRQTVIHDDLKGKRHSPDGFGYIMGSYKPESSTYNASLYEHQKKNNIDKDVWMFSKVSESALDYAITRVNDTVRRGETAIRFELRDGDCVHGNGKQLDDCETHRERTEITDLWLAPLNKTVYYAYSMYIPENYSEMDEPYQIVGQFHDLEANNFNNQYQNGTMMLDIKFNHVDALLASVPEFTKGKWHDFVYQTVWSTDASKGRIIVWMDGKMLIDYQGRTLSDGAQIGPYFKFGIYRSHLERYKHGKHPTQVIYFDEYRHGKTLKDVSFDTTEPLD